MIGDKQTYSRSLKEEKNTRLRIIDPCRKTLEHYIGEQHQQALALDSIFADCHHGFIFYYLAGLPKSPKI